MLNLLRSRDASPILTIFKFSIILCSLGWALTYSLVSSINIPTNHLDGAFQTASGLYRLDAGHAPGKDFYPYLGVGPLLFLFPFFKAFGANISASVAAAQFMVFIVAGVSVALTWHLVWRPKSFLTSLVAGILFLPLSFAIVSVLSLPPPNWLKHMVWPGNSLRPLRAAAPYLVAATYFLAILKNRSPSITAISGGILTGAILLWSNDFAIPTAALFTILFLSTSGRRDDFKLNHALCYIVVTMLFSTIFISTISRGHSLDLLRYYFIDVAKDQWWFFSLYNESRRIFKITQLTKLISYETSLAIIVLVGYFIIAIRTRFVEHMLVVWIGAVLFFGGLIPSVGGHIGGYFGGFYFWGIITLCIGCMHLIWRGVTNITSQMPLVARSQCSITATCFLLLLSACFLIVSLNELRVKTALAHNDPTRFFVPELGGYLGQEWKDYIELAKRSSDAANVIEEYWGIWSATRKAFPKWPVDSAIHALGATRKVAAEALQDADLIIATKHSASSTWQPWNLSQNYWLYQPLFRGWVPYTSSPTTIVWRKRSTSRLFEAVDCSIKKDGGPHVIIQAGHSGFYEAEINYHVTGSGRVLTMIRNNMSFGEDADGYVSVDPKGTHTSFPVYTDAPGPIALDLKIIGSLDHKFDVDSCTAYSLPFFDQEIFRVPGKIDAGFFVTDRTWDRGIARRWPGFFVPNTEMARAEYQVGRRVQFANEERREIIQIVPNGSFLHVYLGGDPLDPGKAGLPSEFVVLDKADHDLRKDVR